MKHTPRPLVLVNPEGLDDIARPLLEDNTIIPSNISPSIYVTNPEKYIILPGKSHGSYSYPDLLVGIKRLNADGRVLDAVSKLGFTISDTSTEKNGSPYIGNINWQQGLKLNLSLGSFTLNLRQYADFLDLLKSGNAFDGNGRKVLKDTLDKILDEILAVREPWRSEWLDADFKLVNNVIHINYDHRLNGNELIPQKSEPLESCLMKRSYIDISSANRQGLPTKKSRNKGVDYYPPIADTNSVARFFANSDGAVLNCYWNPVDSYSRLGVRAAKIKG